MELIVYVLENWGMYGLLFMMSATSLYLVVDHIRSDRVLHESVKEGHLRIENVMTEGFTKAEKARERIYPRIERLGERVSNIEGRLGIDNTADNQ